MNVQMIGPIVAASATIGGIIFQVGKQSEKMDFIGLKVEAQEKKQYYNNQTICEIHEAVSTLKNDVSYIRDEVHEIKQFMRK
jgi:hypothetical protein